MRVFEGLIAVLKIPLLILNWLGAIVSGIWLAVLHDWAALGLGVVLFIQKGKIAAVTPFGALSMAYCLAVVTVWCCGVLFLFGLDATGRTAIPRLIWSYGLATGPLSYMAFQERGASDSVGSGGEGAAATLVTFLAELAYLAVMLTIVFWGISLRGAVEVFGGFMLVGFLVQMTLTVFMLREANRPLGASGE